MAKKKKKRTPYQIAKDKAWEVFSEYIRRKYANSEGYCTCITCGKVAYWKAEGMQAGHAFGGRGNSIIFEERVVRPQCFRCNMHLSGNPDEYHKWVVKQYGEDGYYELLRLKNGKDEAGKDLNIKFTEEGLREMIKGWKEEMKGFKCQ